MEIHIPTPWETRRLVVRNSVPDEADTLRKLYEASADRGPWLGFEDTGIEEDYIEKCLKDGLVPPGGTAERYQFMTFRRKEDNEVIGFIGCYHGYPDAATLYLDFMFFHPDHQKRGYGQEIIAQLTEKAQRKHYGAIRLTVSLKNWSAIRFWLQKGFNEACNFHGDKEHGEATEASIELIKRL